MESSSTEESIQRYGAEGFGRFYGPYRGIVTRNDDDELRGRIQAFVGRTMGEGQLDAWIDPMTTSSGANRGTFWPPEVGDTVWVYFDNGAAYRPTGYVGGWFSQQSGAAALPSEFAYKTKTGSKGEKVSVGPERRGFITRQGHQLFFDDTAGEEAVSLIWHKPDPKDKSVTDRSVTANRATGKSAKLLFKKDGSVEVSNANGTKISLDASGKGFSVVDENGNQITMSGSEMVVESKSTLTLRAATSITLDAPAIALGQGGANPLPKGTDLLRFLLLLWQFVTLHVHTAFLPVPSPTSPPLPAPPAPPAPTLALFSTVGKNK